MKKLVICVAVLLAVALVVPAAFAQAQNLKLGYVDLRKAFYEYEKSKTFDAQLNEVTTKKNDERNKMVEEITKMRDKAALLNDNQKAEAAKQLDAKIGALNEFDRQTRQELLNKKNDMFREIIDDIQKVVEELGKQGGYDYVLDSRNIMFAKPDFDLTAQVLEKLNKK